MRFIELAEKVYQPLIPEGCTGKLRKFALSPIHIDANRIWALRGDQSGTELVLGMAAYGESGDVSELSVSVSETVDQILAKINDISDLLAGEP